MALASWVAIKIAYYCRTKGWNNLVGRPFTWTSFNLIISSMRPRVCSFSFATSCSDKPNLHYNQTKACRHIYLSSWLLCCYNTGIVLLQHKSHDSRAVTAQEPRFLWCYNIGVGLLQHKNHDSRAVAKQDLWCYNTRLMIRVCCCNTGAMILVLLKHRNCVGTPQEAWFLRCYNTGIVLLQHRGGS